VNLLEGVGGCAILGPGEYLTFSDRGEPVVKRRVRGGGVQTKWEVTLSDTAGQPGACRWAIRQQSAGGLMLVVDYGTRIRAFDLTTGCLLWTRPNLVAGLLRRALGAF
jgi:hypothetical protein